MATVLGIDCSDNRKNIGVMPCIANYGKPSGHIQILKGWSAPITDTFNKEYFNNLIQQGTFRVIGNAFGVTTDNGSNTTETGTLQKQAVTSRALPIQTTILKKGYEFAAGYYTNSGQDLYDVIPIYETGLLKVALSIDGTTISGFSVGMYEVGGYEEATDAATAQTSVVFQYDNLQQWNTQGIALSNLDFNPNIELNNIVDVAMTGRADASDNKIYVKTPWLRNPTESISGFSAANFRIELAGVAEAIVGTVTRNSSFEWVIEPTTAVVVAQSWVVKLYDATASPNVAVAKVGTTSPKFYKGQTPAIIAVS